MVGLNAHQADFCDGHFDFGSESVAAKMGVERLELERERGGLR